MFGYDSSDSPKGAEDRQGRKTLLFIGCCFRTGRKGGPTLFLPTFASVMQWGDFLINLKDLDSCSLGLSGGMCTAFDLIMETSNADSLNQCIYGYCWVQSCVELRPHFPKRFNGVMQLLLLFLQGGGKTVSWTTDRCLTVWMREAAADR